MEGGFQQRAQQGRRALGLFGVGLAQQQKHGHQTQHGQAQGDDGAPQAEAVQYAPQHQRQQNTAQAAAGVDDAGHGGGLLLARQRRHRAHDQAEGKRPQSGGHQDAEAQQQRPRAMAQRSQRQAHHRHGRAAQRQWSGLAFGTDSRQPIPLITNDRNGIYQRIMERWLSRRRIVLENVIELGNTETVKSCVAGDLGIALLPRFAVERQLADGTLQAVESDFSWESITAVCSHHKNK